MPNSTLSSSFASVLTTTTRIAQNLLTKFAIQPDFLENLRVAFGNDLATSTALELQNQWQNTDFVSIPPIEVRSAAELQGALGAYSALTNTIFINQDFLAYAAPEQLTDVLLEEIGHSLDTQLNQHDAPGDEGEIFSNLVQGYTLSENQLFNLRTQNDWATVWLDGAETTVELSNTANIGPLLANNNNVQPFLGLNYSVVNQGLYPPRDGGGGVSNFFGEVVMFAGVSNIGLSASGQVLSIAQNTALFSLLGTTYGGDGRTTFALPDLRGRVAVGAGSGPGLSTRSLGESTGSELISVTYPSHNHTVNASGTSTGAASTTVNPSNIQPELALNYIIATDGVFPSVGGGGVTFESYIGEVTLFAGNFAPAGWAFANGQLLSIAQNSALFAILGTTYGGDGVTNFALPDLQGRTAVSSGMGPGLTSRVLGQTGGTETISATLSHSHNMNSFGSTTTTTNATPVAVNNVQPFSTLNYIIAAEGVYPISGNSVPEEQFLGEVRMFAGNFAPSGWYLANGQLLSIAQNQALFSLLGTTYGGNGQTTFALPDLRGRSPVNVGTGVGLTSRVLGEQGGTESESLAWPNHVHSITYPTVNLSVSSNAGTEAGTTVITVTATASDIVSGNQTVNLGVSGTGITTGDYNLSNATITIPNGQTSGSVTFTVIDDALSEGTETATLTISNPSAGITLGSTTTQNIAIADNDLAAIVYVSPTFTGSNGSIIADADLGTNGNQAATQGIDAFATIAAAQAAVATNGTIIVNGGTYAETISLTGTQTLEITGVDTTQSVTIDDLTTAAGNTVILEGASTLSVGDADNRTLAGTINGSGNLTKQGSGTITISGNNTYTGATTISAGTLQATANNALGTAAGTTTVATGATLDLRNVNYSTAESVILQGGAIANGNGTTTFAGNVTMTANSNFDTSSSVLVLAGAVTGNFLLNKRNAGTLRLSNTGNSFTSFNIAGGTIQLGASEVILDTADMSNSSILDLNGFNETLDSLLGNGNITNSQATLATLTVGAGNNNADSRFNGAVSGAINIVKTGTGRQIWGAGGSTYTGTTTIDNGILAVSTESGGLAVQALGAISGNTIVNASGTLELRNVAYALAEPVTLNGGTIRSQTGSSSFGGTITLTGSGFINGAGNLTLNGTIAESGAQSLTFNNTGTVTLTGVNTYTGATTINSGTVLVNGSLAAGSAVTVNNSGILSGDGSVNGAVVIASGGTLRPGSSVGDLDTGTITFVSGSNFTVDINGTTPVTQYDRLNVTGGVNLGGATLNLSGSYTPTANTSFTLIVNDGTDAVNGTFNGLAQGATVLFNGVPLLVNYLGGDGNDVTLSTIPTVSLAVSSAAGSEAGTTLITVTATASSAVLGNQTVNLGVSGTGITAGDYSLSNTTITIPTGQTSGSVTFTVVDDAIVEGSETATLTISNPSAGLVLGSTTTQAITIADNDNAGVVITQSGGNTAVTEGGATDSYTVVLTSQPTADVTITLNPGSQLSTPTTLTFTAQNWNVAQTVAVSAVNDDIAEGNHSGTITHSASSSDNNYNGIAISNVTASITDNDNAGVIITQSNGTTTVTEGGATDTYTVVLSSQPTANVTIALNSGSQTSTNPTSLTFTATNWNVAQTVTVSAIDDLIAEGSHSSTITHTASSGDSNYNGITIANVIASITDNDTAGVIITQSNGSTAVTEGGATDNYTIVLNSQPTANVTITLNSGTQTNTNPTSLTFTSANWNVAQTVTVTAIDDLLSEGTHTGTISHTASSSDANYNGIAIAAVTATITDNDNPPTDITLSASSIDENVAPNTIVGSFTTTDPDGGSFTYTLVPGTNDNNNAFTISGNQLQINNSPDYETLSSYRIRVRTTDSSNLSYAKDFTITINNLNDAPILNDTVVSLASLKVNSGTPSGAVGTPISQIADLVGGSGQNNISDQDAGSRQGIAITAANTANGSWFYSTNNGTNWNPLGNVSNANARLLAADANTRLYFQPNAGFRGTLADVITFHAWDQTSGSNGGTADITKNGGATAFSTAIGTASIEVKPPTVDFNQDGNTDILWHNSINGAVGFWALNGVTLLQAQLIDVVPVASGWEPVGAGDFTGDGNTDILWRNRLTGDNGIWTMNGATRVNAAALTSIPVESGWDVVGVADFTNDGKADILWRNRKTGENGYWEMNGATVVKVQLIDLVDPNSNWNVVGVDDFTNDGKVDILWRNSQTGSNAYWEMNGATRVGATLLETVPPATGWNIPGVGDFNKDGRTDILWRNSFDGQVAVWEMSGSSRIGVLSVSPTVSPTSGWNIV